MVSYITNGHQLYEVLADHDIPNYGLAGGTVHEIVVKQPVEEPAWRETPACPCSRCDRDPSAADGRYMSQRERDTYRTVNAAA